MGKVKKTKKFAAVKRMLNPNDIRLKENQLKQKKKEEEEKAKAVRRVAPVASSLFLAHNTALVPPYRVLIDTNFINFSLQNKLELISGMMDCLFAKCIPCVTDCVMAELEKLGHKYRVALRCVILSVVGDAVPPFLLVNAELLEILDSNASHATIREPMRTTASSSGSLHTSALSSQLVTGNYDDVYAKYQASR
ncbi:rRNA-processing protein fcf1 [Marasmius tenuissimus]|uniref:rRNA-processing protein fcf1 n=1 Tax=Marasmius tenuissimus TaxID=585030 RepID=A0ABR3AGM5_9AGAR